MRCWFLVLSALFAGANPSWVAATDHAAPIAGMPVAMDSSAIVDMDNGNYSITFTDMAFREVRPGTDPSITVVSNYITVILVRTYNSRCNHAGILGYNWGTIFDTTIHWEKDGSLVRQNIGCGYDERFVADPDSLAKLKRLGIDPRELGNVLAHAPKRLGTETLEFSGQLGSGKVFGKMEVDQSGIHSELLDEAFGVDGTMNRAAGFTIRYDEKHRIVEAEKGGKSLLFTRPDATTLRITYSGLSEQDTVVYRFDSRGDLRVAKDVSHKTYSFDYTAGHRVSNINWPDNTNLSLIYDLARDRVILYKDRNDCVEQYQYGVFDDGNEVHSELVQTCQAKDDSPYVASHSYHLIQYWPGRRAQKSADKFYLPIDGKLDHTTILFDSYGIPTRRRVEGGNDDAVPTSSADSAFFRYAHVPMTPEPAKKAPASLLQGGPLPANWDSAPEQVSVPAGWLATFDTMARDTAAQKHEQGACVSYERTAQDVLDLSKGMIQYGNLMRMTNLQKNDDLFVEAKQTEQEALRLRAHLEAAVAGGLSPVFEVTRTTKGMSASVHTPDCIGSEIGDVHTHPLLQGYGMELSLPSDGDSWSDFYTFQQRKERSAFRVADRAGSMTVATQDLLGHFLPTSEVDALNRVRERIKSFINLAEGSSAGSFEDKRAFVAAVLKQYGLVLYQGEYPELHKVAIPQSIDLGWARYSDGKFTARRSLKDLSYAIAKLCVRDDHCLSAAPTGRTLSDNVAELNAIAARAAKMPDEEFLEVMGADPSQKDVRLLSTDANAYYPVGKCAITGKDSVNYVRACQARISGPFKFPNCRDGVIWNMEPSPAVSFMNADPRNEALCHAWSFRLLPDGTVGPFMREVSFPHN